MPSDGSVERAILEGDLEALLARAESARGVAQRRFALAALERGLYAADPGGLSSADGERARAVGASGDAIAVAQRDAPPHAVGVPLVAPDGRAFVRLFHVSFEPHGASEETLGPDADLACQAAIALAASRMTAPPDARRYRLVPATSAVDLGVAIDGRSLSAAAFLSALSLFTDRRVLPRTVVTGELRDGTILAVASITQKLDAARTVGARVFLVPATQARELAEASALVRPIANTDELAALGLSPEPASIDPEQLARSAAQAFREGWSGYRWRGIREALTRALARMPTGRPELSVDLLTRLGAAERHLGDLDASVRALALARGLTDGPLGALAVGDEARSALARHEAMTAKSRGRFADARGAATRAVRHARRGRLRGELEKNLGVAGLVARAAGRDEDALGLLTEALAITLERSPGDAARSRAYRVEALGALGRIDEAREEASMALDEAALDPADRGRAKAAWVRTSLGAALLESSLYAEAREALEVPEVLDAIAREALPGLLARRWLGVALLHADDAQARARGARMLLDSPSAYGAMLEPMLRYAAAVNVVFELAERRDGPPPDPGALEDALAPLLLVPTLAHLLRREVREARRAGGPALRALAWRASRLG